MKKAYIYIAFFLLLMLPVIFLVGCQMKFTVGATLSTKTATTSSKLTSVPTTNIIKPTISSKIYSNSQYNFSLEYPAEWEFEEGLLGTVVFFAGPSEPNYQMNVNLVTEELPKIYSIDDYSKLGELQVKKAHSDYVNLGELHTNISGLPAIIRTFTVTIKSVPLKDTQAYFIKDKTAYIITYDIPIDKYDSYIDSFNLAVSTFKFN